MVFKQVCDNLVNQHFPYNGNSILRVPLSNLNIYIFVFIWNFKSLPEIYKSTNHLLESNLPVIWHPWVLFCCCFVLRFQPSHSGHTRRLCKLSAASFQGCHWYILQLKYDPWQCSGQPEQWHSGSALGCLDGPLFGIFFTVTFSTCGISLKDTHLLCTCFSETEKSQMYSVLSLLHHTKNLFPGTVTKTLARINSNFSGILWTLVI